MNAFIEVIRGAGMLIASVVGGAAIIGIVRQIANSGSFILNIGFMTITSTGMILLLQDAGVQSDKLMRLIGAVLVILFVITIIGTYMTKHEKQV